MQLRLILLISGLSLGAWGAEPSGGNSPARTDARPAAPGRASRPPAVRGFRGQWFGGGLTFFDSKFKVSVHSVDVDFKSTQNGAQAHWDRLLGGHFKSRLGFGTESVSAEASANIAVCNSSPNCSLTLRYLVGKGEIWAGLFNYEEVGVNLGLSGGVVALYPISKSSNAVDVQAMGLTPGLSGGGFFEIRLKPGWWIWAQYSMWKFARGDSVDMESAQGALGVSMEL